MNTVVVTGVPVVSAMTADQENENPRATSTTRPVIMGRQHAVSSMKPQATDVGKKLESAAPEAAKKVDDAAKKMDAARAELDQKKPEPAARTSATGG